MATTLTMNQLQPGQGLRPSVEPITTTWATLLAIRDGGNLIPGQFYRITDYVTTSMAPDTRSAGHPFDIIVRADSANVLNEQAWAVQRKGDTYFKDARLEAWELKYNIDNVQWSQRICTLVIDENDGYTAMSIGTVDIDGETYILWDASEFEDDYDFNRFVSLSKEVGADLLQYDPETGEIVEDGYTTTIAEVIGEYTEPGKGTITWMKDEWGNECPYDFKNIQVKRWKVTDELERPNLDGKYLGVLNILPPQLSIEDENDFIWCYLFSLYDYAGGTQDTTDHSLTGNIYEMDVNFTVGDNNAFVLEYSYMQVCKCIFSGRVQYNTFSGELNNSSFSGSVDRNVFPGAVYNNLFSGNVYNNTFSDGLTQNTFSGNVVRNTFSGNVSGNSFSGNVSGNSFSGLVENSSFPGSVDSSSVSGHVRNSMLAGDLSSLQIKASNGSLGTINCLYTFGSISNKTITVANNATVPTYAAMTSANALKVWNPAD